MKKTLEVLNELKEKGLVENYAIGGGIATIFYTEPVFTYDLDVFVIVKSELPGRIISLTSVYNYLENKGYSWKGEHIVIEDIPVQFIPPSSNLEKEAIENAKDITYEQVKTKVLAAEYLIAIFLKVGRRKDLDKVGRLIEQANIDKNMLKKIFKRYSLYDRYDRFKKWGKGLK